MLLRRLQSEDAEDWWRAEAAERLADLGAVEAIPILIEMVRDDGGLAWVPPAIAEFGETGLRALTDELRNSDVEIRRKALDAFASLGARGLPVLDEVITATRDTDPAVRQRAIYALEEIGAPLDSFALVLVERFLDPDDDTAGVAFSALVDLPAHVVIAKLSGLVATAGTGRVRVL